MVINADCGYALNIKCAWLHGLIIIVIMSLKLNCSNLVLLIIKNKRNNPIPCVNGQPIYISLKSAHVSPTTQSDMQNCVCVYLFSVVRRESIRMMGWWPVLWVYTPHTPHLFVCFPSVATWYSVDISQIYELQTILTVMNKGAMFRY